MKDRDSVVVEIEICISLGIQSQDMNEEVSSRRRGTPA